MLDPPSLLGACVCCCCPQSSSPTDLSSICLQARVLYHEAAVLEGLEGGSGSKPSEQRLGLLRDALDAASQATALNPASLSSAALRATCVVNVLVEESSLSSSSSGRQGEGGSGSGRLDDARCQRIKEDFREALASCGKALSASSPTFIEPVISLSDGNSQTCDPCCLVRGGKPFAWARGSQWTRDRGTEGWLIPVTHACAEGAGPDRRVVQGGAMGPYRAGEAQRAGLHEPGA